MIEVREESSIRQLFIRNCIPPEPSRATRLRQRMYREVERTREGGRRPGETDSRFRARMSGQREKYTTAIRQILFDGSQYTDWHPSPENWVQLCVALAFRHDEPGFAFKPSRRDLRAENTFVQDNLIYGLLQRGAKSVAEAAREAEKVIQRERREGGAYFPQDGSEPIIRNITAASLKSGYSARKRNPAKDLPPSISNLLNAEAHVKSILHEALSETRWPEQRFYSPDALDDCLARLSEEHAMGPLAGSRNARRE